MANDVKDFLGRPATIAEKSLDRHFILSTIDESGNRGGSNELIFGAIDDGEAPPTPAYLRAIALRCASVPKSLSARSRFGRGRRVYDVHEKNLGYDLMSLDLNPGELRLIEGEGLGGAAGSVLLTPNEKRVAEDRRDCYWLYVVTDCKTEPKLQNPIKDPARLQ